MSWREWRYDWGMDRELVIFFFLGGLVALAVLVAARWALGRWERRLARAGDASVPDAPERIPPELVRKIQGDFEDLTLRMEARKASAAQWPSKERLDLLEARHGALPEFVQELIERSGEPPED